MSRPSPSSPSSLSHSRVRVDSRSAYSPRLGGGGVNGSGPESGPSTPHLPFFALIQDAAAQHLEKERAYYLREEEKINQTVAQMEKCQILTDEMLSILDHFDEKLSAMESSMLPIHKGTQALTTAQKNIDSTLAETDKIILHYTLATESDDSVNSHLLNSVDYEAYLGWVERIQESIQFFTTNKERLAHSNQGGEGGNAGGAGAGAGAGGGNSQGGGGASGGAYASDFDKYLRKLLHLNKRVMNECEHEFERVLAAHSKTPLDLTRTGWPLPATVLASGEGIQPFQLVPSVSVRELSMLAQRMSMANNFTHYGILLQLRSAFLRMSLKKVFNEELKFVSTHLQGVNQAAATSAAATKQPVMVHQRGSILIPVTATSNNNTTAAINNILGGGSGDINNPSALSSLAGEGGATSLATTAPSTASSHLYQKGTHKSVFYLEFFLKLLELEHEFLLQCLAHIFNREEAEANGLDVSLLRGEGGPKGGIGPQGSSMLSSLSHGVVGSHASTGSLTTFHGQEAYDQLYANIVEAPLEYFRKKMDQHTYIKDGPYLKLSAVFGHHGAGKGSHHHHGADVGGLTGSSLSSLPSGSASTSSSHGQPLGTSLSNKVLILLDVLDQLNNLLPRYRMLLKKHAHFERLIEFQTSITTLARKTLFEYREYLVCYTTEKGSSSSGSSGHGALSSLGGGGSKSHKVKDGTIHTLTVETLNFLRRIHEYRRVIEATPTLLDKYQQQHVGGGGGSNNSQSGAGGGADAHEASSGLLSLIGGSSRNLLDDRFAALASGGNSSSSSDHSPMTSLCAFLLSGLEHNLESKAKGYKLPSLSAIFLLNNFHYCSKYLKKHAAVFLHPPALTGSGEVGTRSSSAGLQSFVDRYDRLVHTTMKQYRTASWEKVVSHALEASDMAELMTRFAATASHPSSSGHKAARKAIKAKFQLFNSSFEELYNTQRHFSIPDSDLRSQLRNDNVELILQSYKMLYNTFSGVDFSRNNPKYCKYSPQVLEAMLNKFFDEED